MFSYIHVFLIICILIITGGIHIYYTCRSTYCKYISIQNKTRHRRKFRGLKFSQKDDHQKFRRLIFEDHCPFSVAKRLHVDAIQLAIARAKLQRKARRKRSHVSGTRLRLLFVLITCSKKFGKQLSGTTGVHKRRVEQSELVSCGSGKIRNYCFRSRLLEGFPPGGSFYVFFLFTPTQNIDNKYIKK